MRAIKYITEDDKIYIDFKTIKELLGYSRSTTQRELKRLQNKEFLKIGNGYLYSKENVFELLEKSLIKKMMR